MAPLDPQCDWLRLDLLDAEPKVSRASSESSTPSARGETRFGDYKILGTLGSGGMGVVYRARQHGIDREVAIKSLSQVALIDSTARARFQSELKILGKLRHSNIVQVHESGFDQGVPYLVMEYVAGGTLKDLIQERSPHRRVSELMIEVARAVDWAHGQGIIHRDLKPSNIFLTEAGQPKVADFGIALEIEETQNFTRTGELVGTPVYMPPERLNGTQLLKPSSDVYALGVVLHELLTGVVPFAGDSLSAVLVQVMSRDSLPLQTWTPNLPRDLDTICRKCLKKDAARRYQTAAEFADDLQRFLDNRPIAARPIGYWEKTWRWCRRQPLAAALAGGLVSVVFMAVVGLTVGLLLMSDMNRDLNDANADLKQINIDLDEARQSAEAQKNGAETTLRFVVESFRGADPAQDPQTQTMFDLLQKMAQNLGAQETLDPATRRSLLQAIGLTFIGRGEYAEAVKVLERANDVVEDHFDPDDLDSLATRHDLALAYRFNGRYKDAISLFERVRGRRVQLLGPDHRDSLLTANNLAAVYVIVGREAEAIEIYEQVHKKREAILGPNDRATLTTLNDLAGAYRSVKRLEDAIRLYKLVRSGMEKKLGVDHLDTLNVIDNLAISYDIVGRSADAISLFEYVLELRVKKLGLSHPHTLDTLHGLARAHQKTGNYKKAIEYYTQERDEQTKKLGVEHWNTLHAINGLAETYRLAGHANNAIPLHEFVLGVRLREIGAEHPHTLTTKCNLASAYRDVGRTTEALEMLEQVLEIRQKKFGSNHPSTINALRRLEVVHRAVIRKNAAAAKVNRPNSNQ